MARKEKVLVAEVVSILRRCGFDTARGQHNSMLLHSAATGFLDRNGLEWADWYGLVLKAHEHMRATRS